MSTLNVLFIDELVSVQDSGVMQDNEVLYLERSEDKVQTAREVLALLPKNEFTKNYLFEIDYNFNYGPKENGRMYKDESDPMSPKLVIKTNRLDVITFNKIIYNIIDPTYRVGRIVVTLNGISHQVSVMKMLESLPMKTYMVATKIK